MSASNPGALIITQSTSCPGSFSQALEAKAREKRPGDENATQRVGKSFRVSNCIEARTKKTRFEIPDL